MKILYISTRIDGSGGLQRSISVRLNYLAENGYEIHLLTTNSENRPIYFPLDKRIKHIDIQYVSRFFRYRKLIKSVYKNVNPEIVVVSDNGLKGFLVPYFIPKRTKIIYELHATRNLIIKESNRFFRLFGMTKILMNHSSEKFDAFVFLSEKEAKLWKVKNQVVIPNPVSFTASEKSSLENKKIIFAGRQNLVKGIDLLLEIWSKINKKHPDWVLEIYGEKSTEFDTPKMVNQKGLNSSVFVSEPVSDILTRYKESSILFLTSRFESFGLVLVEAMFCGLPCISFDAPNGPSSIIENNQNGFLIPCFDLDLFVEKAFELIENENFRKSMGENALKSVEKFELQNVMNQWMGLYQKVYVRVQM